MKTNKTLVAGVTCASLSGCARFNNAYNDVQHACGVTEWERYEGKALYQLLGPDGSSVAPEVLDRLSLHGREGIRPLSVTPHGCFALEPGEAGILGATVPTHNWGISIPIDGSFIPGELRQLRMKRVVETPVILTCPQRRAVPSERDLLLPFQKKTSEESPGTRFFLEVTHTGHEKKSVLTARPDPSKPEFLIPDPPSDGQPLSEGAYVVTARSEDILGRTVFSEPCSLTLDSTTPKWSKRFTPMIIRAEEPLDLGDVPGARTFVCFEKESNRHASCRSDDAFVEFRRYTNVPGPGVWQAHAFAESPAGLRSSTTTWLVSADESVPALKMRWAEERMNHSPSLVSQRGGDLTVHFEASDDVASEQDLLSSLQCRVEAGNQQEEPARTYKTECTSGKCAGKNLHDWVPCSSPFSFRLADPAKAVDIKIAVHARLNDGVKREGQAKLVTWVLRDALEEWNVWEEKNNVDWDVHQIISQKGDQRFTGIMAFGTPLTGTSRTLFEIEDDPYTGRSSEPKEVSKELSEVSSATRDSTNKFWITNGWDILVYDPNRGLDTPFLKTQGTRPRPTRDPHRDSGNPHAPQIDPVEQEPVTTLVEISPGALRALTKSMNPWARYDHLSQSWLFDLPLPQGYTGKDHFLGVDPTGKPWFLSEEHRLVRLTSDERVEPIQIGSPSEKCTVTSAGKAVFGNKSGDSFSVIFLNGYEVSECRFQGNELTHTLTWNLPANATAAHVLFDETVVIGDHQGLLRKLNRSGSEDWVSIPRITDGRSRFDFHPFPYGITSLGTDKHGKVWAGGRHGLAHHDGCYWATFPKMTLEFDPLRVYSTAKLEALIIETASGYWAFEKNAFIPIPPPPGKPEVGESPFEDLEGNLCIAMEGSRYAFLGQNAYTWSSCELEGTLSEVKCDKVCSLGRTAKSWIHKHGRSIWSQEENSPHRKILEHQTDTDAFLGVDRQGRIWRGREKGFELYLPEEGAWRNTTEDLLRSHRGVFSLCIPILATRHSMGPMIGCKDRTYVFTDGSQWVRTYVGWKLSGKEIETPDNHTWSINDGTLEYWNGHQVQRFSDTNSDFPFWAESLAVTAEGQVWTVNGAGLSIFQEQCGKRQNR